MVSDNLSAAQFPVIRKGDLSTSDARRSRAVSNNEFQGLAARGQKEYESLKSNSSPASGLDKNWSDTVGRAHAAASEPWGGATIDAHSGEFLNDKADHYIISAREPGTNSISIPAGSHHEHFAAAMTAARENFRPVLERANHHLGVFNDADKGTVDFDPVTTVSKKQVESVGAYTRATGGAYHPKSGDGFWPPHVRD